MITIKTKSVSGGAICSALSVVLLFLASYIPLKIAILFATSVVMGVCVLKYRPYVSLLTYFAVSLLSFFILPNKLMAFMYILVFGVYPIVKFYIEKLHKIVFEYIFKAIFWSIEILGIYVVLSALGQNALLDLGNTWFYLGSMILLLGFDLVYSIFINGFYKTYYKYLN